MAKKNETHGVTGRRPKFLNLPGRIANADGNRSERRAANHPAARQARAAQEGQQPQQPRGGGRRKKRGRRG